MLFITICTLQLTVIGYQRISCRRIFRGGCPGILVGLTAAPSLASLASTSCLIILSKSSILQASLPVSLEICKRMSLGNFVMVTGMSRLLYCTDVTPSTCNPRTWTIILSKIAQRETGLSPTQLEIFNSPSMCALIICCGFPNLSCNMATAES